MTPFYKIKGGYGFHFLMYEKSEDPNVTIIRKFSFKTQKNRRYIVDVYEYAKSIYVLKFYPTSLSNCVNKYQKLLHDFDARKILYTCFNIGLSILEVVPNASFAFLGERLETECCTQTTKRYRVYKMLAHFFISDSIFTHVHDENVSVYALLNKNNEELSIENLHEITRDFSECYDVNLQLQSQD